MISKPVKFTRILFVLLMTCQACAERPNILFVLIDDLRPELSPYGAEHMHTPNFERLSQQSVRFERAYTQQAVCLPARISLFSGQYPQTTGVTTLQDKFWQLHENPLTLTRLLRENGYRTIGMGKIYHDEQWREWDDWTEMMNISDVLKSRYASPESEAALAELEKQARALGLEGKEYRQFVRLDAVERTYGSDDRYHDIAMTQLAIEKVRKYAKDETPFFLSVGYRKPHLPFVAPKRYWDLYNREALPVPAQPTSPERAPPIALTEWGELRAFKGIPARGPIHQELAQELVHGYLACVSMIDDQIGRLLNVLEEENLMDNTIIVVWGDHGWKLGDLGMWCKHTNYEIDVRIPLFIRLPKEQTGGSATYHITETIDIFPTICELVGLAIPSGCEGKSLLPVLRNPTAPSDEVAYAEFQRTGQITGFSVRTAQFRYTEWIQMKNGEVYATELYDLARDPNESTNIAGLPETASTIATLAPLLHAGPADNIPSSIKR